jgi:hypothetical protein
LIHIGELSGLMKKLLDHLMEDTRQKDQWQNLDPIQRSSAVEIYRGKNVQGTD